MDESFSVLCYIREILMKVKIRNLIKACNIEENRLKVGDDSFEIREVKEFPEYKRKANLITNVVVIVILAFSAVSMAKSNTVASILMLGIVYIFVLAVMYQVKGRKYRSWWKVNGNFLYVENEDDPITEERLKQLSLAKK